MLGKRSSPEKITDQEPHSPHHDQNMAASQENQSFGPGALSPYKKQRPFEIPQESHLKDDEINTDDWNPSSESYCLSKTITSSDLNQDIYTLHVDVSEAITLADDPDIVYHPAYRYRKDLMVVDEVKRRYKMQLTNYIADRRVKYWVEGEWYVFFRNHNLKAGDEIIFYKLETGGLGIKVAAVEKKGF